MNLDIIDIMPIFTIFDIWFLENGLDFGGIILIGFLKIIVLTTERFS